MPTRRLLPTDASYPAKLRDEGVSLPIELVGNHELLNRPAIAVIGSRHCSEKGFYLADRVASASAEFGICVISGYAKGVDTAAHLGALRSKGETISVLPFGTDHFRIKQELKRFVSGSNFLAVSQFPPHQRWFAHAAMRRNRLICALADAVVVIEAGEHGGTVEGAKVARELERPLYVIACSSPPQSAVGNQMLISTLGAEPLRNWGDVVRVLESHGNGGRAQGDASAVQQSLF